MNLTESLAFDTEAARLEAEIGLAPFKGVCCTDAVMTAYEIIDLLKIELARLHAYEAEKEAYFKQCEWEHSQGVKATPNNKSVTSAMVLALRDKTDEPMMLCKKALTVANGDTKQAEEWLQTRGLHRMGIIN